MSLSQQERAGPVLLGARGEEGQQVLNRFNNGCDLGET